MTLVAIELEHFLKLLERERILFFLVPGPCALEQLGDGLLTGDLVDLGRSRVICGSMLPSASSSATISPANWKSPFSSALVAVWIRGCVRDGSNRAIGSLRYAFCSVSPNSFAVSNRVPRLLGHRLVHDAADDVADRRIQIGRRRRNLRQDRLDDDVLAGASEGLPPRQRFVQRHPERVDIGLDRDRLVLHLLRRHVEQRALVIAGRPRAGMHRVRHAEVDDLHRVVGHHEDVARLQIAMDEAALVRGMKTAARLREDLDHALHRQTMAGAADESDRASPRAAGA